MLEQITEPVEMPEILRLINELNPHIRTLNGNRLKLKDGRHISDALGVPRTGDYILRRIESFPYTTRGRKNERDNHLYLSQQGVQRAELKPEEVNKPEPTKGYLFSMSN